MESMLFFETLFKNSIDEIIFDFTNNTTPNLKKHHKLI